MYGKGHVGMALTASLAWAAVGCGSSTSMGPGGGGSTGSASVSLSLAVRGSSALPSITLPGGSFDLTLGDGQGSTVTITRVALVLKEVELKLQDELCEDSSDGVDSDLCEEFQTGPQVFALPMDSTVAQVLAVNNVPPGVYDAVKFKIHKLSGQSDSTVIAANPELDQISIRVEGTYDDGSGPVAFVYQTDLDEEHEVAFAMPLTVGPAVADSVNVTLSVDVDGWFRDASGALLDPSTANKGGLNENLVKNNIRASLEGFEDDDHDGIED